MRELKFRAFLLPDFNRSVMRKDVMYEVQSIWFEHNSIEINDKAVGLSEVYPLMQYTGLKDKNGKEIYEGDIVTAWSQGYQGKFEIRWRQSGCPCYILYPAWQNKEAWYINASEYKMGKQFIDVEGKISTSLIDDYIDEGLEIIGNIYEHPELLEK